MEEILVFLIGFFVVMLMLVLPVTTLATVLRMRRDQEDGSRKLDRVLRDVNQSIQQIQGVTNDVLDRLGGKAPAPPGTEVEHEVATKPMAAAEPPVEMPVEMPVDVEPELVEAEPIEQETDRQETVKPWRPPAPVTAPPPVEQPVAAFSSSADEPAPHPQLSQFEIAAKDVVRKIWNWIIVGADKVPEGVSIEYAIASNWLLRIGILILVVGVGFFLKYSIENGLITPTGRVAISTVAGLGMLIAGTQMLGRKYHLLGQGLIGGGLATMYFAVFAAANFYHLIELEWAFGLMAMVTVLAGWMAVRFDSALVAVLGIIGGYGTPIMLSSAEPNFIGLYVYILVLGVGVLGICYRKNWPLLSYLSMLYTYALYGVSLSQYEAAYFWQVMPFLTAFFVLFSTMVFAYNIVSRERSNLLDVLVLFLNAGVYFAASYQLVVEAYSRQWAAAVTVTLAAFYVAHVYIFLRRQLLDRGLLVSFTGLASFFLAISVPLLLSGEWITVTWSIQALVMLWIAVKMRSEFLRYMAYLVYALVLFRLGAIDMNAAYFGAAARTALPWAEYLPQLLERVIMFGVPIASIAGAARLMSRPTAAAAFAVTSENDVAEWIPLRFARQAATCVVVTVLFVFLNLEFNCTVGYLYEPLRLPSLSWLWVGLSVYLLVTYLRTANRAVLAALGVVVSCLVIKLFAIDLPSWHVTARLLTLDEYSFGDAGLRLFDFGGVIGFLVLAFNLLNRREPARELAKLFGFAALGLLFVALTLEVNTFLDYYVRGLRAGGVSILWSLFALALILAGIGKDYRALRFIGLALFGVVAFKVFFMDLVRLDQIYRIVAFVLLGILTICGSFIYLKYRQTFAIDAPVAKGKDE